MGIKTYMFLLLSLHKAPRECPIRQKDQPGSMLPRQGDSTGDVKVKLTPEQNAGADGSAVSITARTRSSLSHKSKTWISSVTMFFPKVFLLQARSQKSGFAIHNRMHSLSCTVDDNDDNRVVEPDKQVLETNGAIVWGTHICEELESLNSPKAR